MSQLDPTIQPLGIPKKVPFAPTLERASRALVQRYRHLFRPKRRVYLGWFGGVQIYQKGGRQ